MKHARYDPFAGERYRRKVAREEAVFRFFVFVFGVIAPIILVALMVMHYAHIQP